MLVSPVIFGDMERPMLPGDILNTNEIVAAIVTAGSQVLTAANMLSALIWRTGPGAGYGDTTPDAASWINAMLQQAYNGGGATTPSGVQVGTTYRMRMVNTVAFANTVVAGANVTLAGTTAVAASTWRDFLVTVLNGTPAQQFAATTTNASAVVTGLTADQTSKLSPGMAVTGTGVPASTTILSIQPGVGFTMSANATASGVLVALTFNPRVELRGIGSGPI